MTLLHSKGHCWILHQLNMQQCYNAATCHPQPNYCIYNAAIFFVFYQCQSQCVAADSRSGQSQLLGKSDVYGLLRHLLTSCTESSRMLPSLHPAWTIVALVMRPHQPPSGSTSVDSACHVPYLRQAPLPWCHSLAHVMMHSGTGHMAKHPVTLAAQSP